MWANAASVFHSGAWLLWLMSAMLAALLTRNPFYLTLVLAVGIVVNRQLSAVNNAGESGDSGIPASSSEDSATRGRALLVRAVVGVTLVVALLKGLSLHLGTTVLFRLPEEWPVIGGPITLEAMISSGLDALSLMTVLAVFAAFSAGADYYALLRSVPPAMHQVGLVASIAITFVPQTVVRFTEIREAQALRGHRVRRVGDLLPWILPLLAGGMERSLNLAEAMEARGFSRASALAQRLPPIAVQSGLVLGLGLVLVGGALFAFYPQLPWVAWLCIVVGVGLISATLWAVGRGVKRSRYRHSVWRQSDTVLSVVSLAVLAILLGYKGIAASALVYDPLARLRVYLPPFDPAIAVALVALAVPAVVVRMMNRRGQDAKDVASIAVAGSVSTEEQLTR